MTNKHMKAWVLEKFGIDHLKLTEIGIPEIKSDELLIKVSAVSLNFRDKAVVEGFYDPNALANGPFIPVSDAVGTVVALGNEVKRFQGGDRVMTHFHSKWIDGARKQNEGEFTYGSPLPGGLAEYMVLHEDGAITVPDYLSNEEAATLPIAALTAWFALRNVGNLVKGNTVLIQGTGGVSIFAIQIANAMGLNAIVLTSSDEKAETVLSLGAKHVLNYHKIPDWENEVLKLTDNKGVDEVLEVVGGDINKSISSLKVDGTVALIGFLIGGADLHLNMLPVLGKQIRIQGIATGHRKAFEEMCAFFEQYHIRPLIEKIYSFENAIEAFKQIGNGAMGKLTIKVR